MKPAPTSPARYTRPTVHVQFRIGPDKKGALCPLLIRLIIGNQVVNEYASGVYVHPQLWQQAKQACVGVWREVPIINARLREIQNKHRELLRDAQAAYQAGTAGRPTAAFIAQQWVDFSLLPIER